MTLTSGSARSSSIAALTFASVAPPPPSRKLVGYYASADACFADSVAHLSAFKDKSIHGAHCYSCSVSVASNVALSCLLVEQLALLRLCLKRVLVRLAEAGKLGVSIKCKVINLNRRRGSTTKSE